jgi:starvation-inducible outer membrane lipoprotein
MRRLRAAIVLPLVLPLLTCACTPQFFPPQARKGVDTDFDFSRWRLLPTQAENRKIQLGGRVVQSTTKGETVTIVAVQLPIVEHPAYGPKDTKKRSGEFAIMYQGKIDPLFLQAGNRLMVIGHTRPMIRVEVDDIMRSLPALTAQCIHFWNTGDKDIADFVASGAGYETLREETYCEASQD